MSGAADVMGGAAAVAGGRLRSMRVDGYFDPGKNFLDATARLRFSGPAGARELWLANELQLRWVRGGSVTVEPFASETGLFVVDCPPENELEFSYSGRLAYKPDPFDPDPKRGAAAGSDDLRFLSYITDYYPHLSWISRPWNEHAPQRLELPGQRHPRAVQAAGPGTRILSPTRGQGHVARWGASSSWPVAAPSLRLQLGWVRLPALLFRCRAGQADLVLPGVSSAGRRN
jgi:hypothetical protein